MKMSAHYKLRNQRFFNIKFVSAFAMSDTNITS